MSTQTKISWLLRMVVAVIYLQTLFYKFSAHPESVKIFTLLHVEPYGRLALGVTELIVATLLLIPATMLIGIVGSIAIITGAIVSHIIVLGTNVNGDGGRLFLLAMVVFFASLALAFIHQLQFKQVINKILPK